MGLLYICTIFLSYFLILANGANNFSTFYYPLWGGDHFSINPQGTEVQLKFDRYTGAGFRSKYDYGSGWFHIRMKIPDRPTGGVVTSFYLTSAPDNQDPGNHFELDYEFLGTNGTVQTNVYDNDTGHREQSFRLWFNPSQDFHTYEFLWNSNQIVFFIDKIPVRVFKNNIAKGIPYPNKPMHIEASIWNADWAGKVDWSHAPFIAHYQDFNFYACQGTDVSRCGSQGYLWNRFTKLSPQQRAQMNKYRKYHMVYDYCAQPATRKPECSLN
ncbi:hypothetical protein RD792_012455 [Penstemon davidsonii]|uniref:Xyloglucan endotransglucosylase/hydrolase n=1 Tax=Penstemon davidsonii TaxID=160366 RepID=A0ABR0CWW7_9LAMI|nr:hypothetical protein RD792_012455 [Penstemon davidsonii]